MNEAFEYYGEWHVPGDDDNSYWGTLAYEPESGLTLVLNNWKNQRIKTSKERISYPIILGVSTSSKEGSFSAKHITLWNCQAVSPLTPIHFLEGGKFKFYINMAFIGVHFKNPEAIKFKEISVRYLHVDEWFGISGFKPFKPILNKSRGITLKYKIPKPVIVSLEHFKLTFRIAAKGPAAMITQKEATISQTAWIDFEPPKETEFIEFRRVIDCIQNFLTVATVKHIYPLYMDGISEANKQNFNSNAYYPRIAIFYGSMRFSQASREMLAMNMLFTYSRIKNRKKKILDTWIKKDERIAPIFSLFLSIFNPRVYLEDKFLNLAYCLEALHRRTRRNREISPSAHKKRLSHIMRNVPVAHKEWLQNKLAYSNEPSLRNRLKDLYGDYQDMIPDVWKEGKNVISRICDTRNYFTHYDPSLVKKAAHGDELYSLTRFLKSLLLLCFLSEVGFSKKEIKELIAEHFQE